MVIEYNDNTNMNKGFSLILFYAAFNSNCTVNKEMLERISVEFNNITFYKVNTTSYYRVKQDFGVMRIPSYVLLNDGKEVGRITGNTSSQVLKTFLRKNTY